VATVVLDRVSKRFGEFLAVDDFSLEVAEGEVFTIGQRCTRASNR